MAFKNIPLSKADFEACNWEEVIANCPQKECFNYTQLFFAKGKEADANGDAKSHELFTLLTAVTAFSLRSDSANEPYGQSARLLEGVLDSHLEALRDIASEIKEAEMRARIADLLWVKKRDFRMAELAIEAYLESAKLLEDPDHWPPCAERIERATRIAVSIGPSNKGLTQVFSHIENVLNKYNVDDTLFLSSRMMDLLLEFSKGDPAKYAPLAEKAATRAEAEDNWHKARVYWETKARWHELEENPDSKRETLVKAAETYVKEAEVSITGPNPSYLAAVTHLQKAIEAHRRIGGNKSRVEELHKLLLNYEAESVNELKPLYTTLNASDKVREEIDKAVASVKGRNFSDALFELALMLRLPKVESLKAQARKSVSEHPIQHLLASMAIDREGKMVGKKPSMLSGDEDVDLALRAEMFFHAAINENVDVPWILAPVVRQILREHTCRLSEILPLVSNNPLVPPGREMFYAKGIQAGLRSDLDIAAHFLIPQLEHSIRFMLAQQGTITSSIDQEGIQQEYDLNKTLYMPATKEIFGEDIVFHLQRILVEALGANLRNKMAHGMMSYDEFSTIPVAYLWWLTLYLVCFPFIAASRNEPETLSKAADRDSKVTETAAANDMAKSDDKGTVET